MTVVILLQALFALSVARHLGTLSTGRALLTLALFVPESIARRLLNDYDDFKRGVDVPENARRGSALALGLSMRRVRAVGLVCFAAGAGTMGWLLYTTSPWSLVAFPLSFAVLVYSGGPVPLGHRGLGEALDFVAGGFYVVAAVIWVNVHRMPLAGVTAAATAGFLFAATMFHNDLRDATEDIRAGKRTLAHALSPLASKVCYAVFVLGPFPCLAVTAYSVHSWRFAVPLVLLPYALWLVVGVARSRLGGTMPSWGHLPRLLTAVFALLSLAVWI
ncbi:prenyltransferase [Kitasatospora sp. NPDC006697]|uniref:prenyltransferase n=1 Tax=Kitasatospora sp. NPDC006697 TaxID=3364020 RepID=UPI0036B51020